MNNLVIYSNYNYISPVMVRECYLAKQTLSFYGLVIRLFFSGAKQWSRHKYLECIAKVFKVTNDTLIFCAVSNW